MDKKEDPAHVFFNFVFGPPLKDQLEEMQKEKQTSKEFDYLESCIFFWTEITFSIRMRGTPNGLKNEFNLNIVMSEIETPIGREIFWLSLVNTGRKKRSDDSNEVYNDVINPTKDKLDHRANQFWQLSFRFDYFSKKPKDWTKNDWVAAIGNASGAHLYGAIEHISAPNPIESLTSRVESLEDSVRMLNERLLLLQEQLRFTNKVDFTLDLLRTGAAETQSSVEEIMRVCKSIQDQQKK